MCVGYIWLVVVRTVFETSGWDGREGKACQIRYGLDGDVQVGRVFLLGREKKERKKHLWILID